MITQSSRKQTVAAAVPVATTQPVVAARHDVDAQAAITAARSDRLRCEAILSDEAAVGRERLASHLTYETAFSVSEARAILAAAAFEPGSRPAIAAEQAALARSIINAGRVRR